MGSVFTCCQQTGRQYSRGITPLAPCTNIKNYWSARHSCASSIRNYMSYANYVATNQIHVVSCIFIDIIIMIVT